MEKSPWETPNWSWLAGVMSARGSFTLARTSQKQKWGLTHFVKYVLRSSTDRELVERFAAFVESEPKESSLGLQVTLNADALHQVMIRIWDAGLTDQVKRRYKELKLQSNATRFDND